MIKRFKLTPELTCPELDGYKLPEMPKYQHDDVSVDSYAVYNKQGEKLEFTESDLMKAIEMARKYPADVAGFQTCEIIASLRTPRIPIAIEVEWIESWIGAEFDEPDTNEDGTVKGVWVYE
jgi:hypothetical protein